MLLCIRYILLRLSVKMWVSCMWCYVPCTTVRMAFNLALSMFCNLGSLSTIRRLLAWQ